MQLLVKCAAGLVAWGCYSSVCRQALQPSFQRMRLLAETRPEAQNATLLAELAAGLAPLSDPEAIPGSWESYWGIQSTAGRAAATKSTVTWRGDPNNLLVSTTSRSDDDDNNDKPNVVGLFGPRLPKDSLSTLVQRLKFGYTIVQDARERATFMRRLQECQGVVNCDSLAGSYYTAFRDYVNFEEQSGMVAARGGIENFLFRPARPTLLQVGESDTNETENDNIDMDKPTCLLQEKFYCLGFLPLEIEWKGQIREDDVCAIHWTTTKCQLGWPQRGIGKVWDRPAAAEKLRQERWIVKQVAGATDHDSLSDLAVFTREGVGSLVFAKKHAFAG